MKINRQEFLNDLQMVKAGLSTKELLAQSSSFVFRGGVVFTFNDEIFCRKKTALTIEGAVRADKLLAILDKMPETDEYLEVLEDADGRLEFRGKYKRFALSRDAEVLLPIEKLLEEQPQGWGRLPASFGEVINHVKECVSTDESNHFALTCVHLHPDYIEACDTRQLLRWRIKLGNKRPMLVRGSTISQIVGLGVSQISATDSWIHFRHANGLIFSCRKFTDEYPEMDDALNVDGAPIQLPKNLVEVSERATIFASDTIQGAETVLTVFLSPGRIRLLGQGGVGTSSDYYEEIKACNYKGPKIDFKITPNLLRHVTENFNDATITQSKLKASGGSKEKVGLWDYVTVLGSIKKEGAEEPSPEQVEGHVGEEAANYPEPEENPAE